MADMGLGEGLREEVVEELANLSVLVLLKLAWLQATVTSCEIKRHNTVNFCLCVIPA